MDFVKFKQQADRLYHEYLKLLQMAGGEFPKKFPGMWRSQYEEFSLFVDLTDTEENIAHKIDELKKEVFLAREERLSSLERANPNKAVVNAQPRRSDGKKIANNVAIEKAEKALAVYHLHLKNVQKFAIATEVFGLNGAVSEAEVKNAERNVAKYQAHAEKLIIAAGNGSFFDALNTPLPKK